MSGAAHAQTATRSDRKTATAIVVSAGIGALSIFEIGWIGGYRINLTPSEPLGLWRIVPLDRPATVGDVVFICPPETAAMREARSRGYLRSGLCPAGYAPLIKTIIGVAGQDVEVGVDVRIAGHSVPRSNISVVDGEGRPLTGWSGGVITVGFLFIHSDFIGSFDSRYFGPIPASSILGLAREVWTYVP
ncbi:conjugative transfer signal peptidase TraF [Pararhizobium antarcticum]|uniref:Conjugal transfer protein TraF n=1 Tax=Pararhizobium antarcticum TaxID=1798805 RepID=A0A657LRA3_9HYPH|nr:conjugative transfer signal peptidase TraF [Pararhizobium antarcticum]OJF91491.1 conjugal transfer protein TraF [Pararhizobium antarcticum]